MGWAFLTVSNINQRSLGLRCTERERSQNIGRKLLWCKRVGKTALSSWGWRQGPGLGGVLVFLLGSQQRALGRVLLLGEEERTALLRFLGSGRRASLSFLGGDSDAAAGTGEAAHISPLCLPAAGIYNASLGREGGRGALCLRPALIGLAKVGRIARRREGSTYFRGGAGVTPVY